MDNSDNIFSINSNYLHSKPICARIFSGLAFANETIKMFAPVESRWQGKLVRNATKGIILTGYALNSMIALVETIGALTILGLGEVINIATLQKSSLLQNRTTKCWAYCLNSRFVLYRQMEYLKSLSPPLDSEVITISNHLDYLYGAVIAQSNLYKIFDQHAEKISTNPNELPPVVIRCVELVIEATPLFGTGLSRSEAREFFETNPQYAQQIQNYISSIHDIRSQKSLGIMLTKYISTCLIPHRVNVPNNVIEFDDNLKESDTKYQNELLNHIKAAVKELYKDEKLVRLMTDKTDLKEARQAWLEALECFDPSIFIPIAHYTQIKELEKEISCPIIFEAEKLKIYDSRQKELKDAKEALEKLNKAEKAFLIGKLLKGDSFDIEQKFDLQKKTDIEQLHATIGHLGGVLHEGKLLSRKAIDISNPLKMHPTGVNLFQKACREATEELSKETCPLASNSS